MRKALSFVTLGLSLAVLAACGTTTTPDTSPTTTMTSSSAAPTTSDTGWKWDNTILTGKHTAVISTSKGDITVELDADVAPKTVTNFMALAASGYYDNLTFHRVIPGFMIQGGDPNGNGSGGHSIFGDMFEDEIKADSDTYKVGYKTGVIAMANRGPNTNGSQFFIMDADYPLPPNYTIFGHVTSGIDIVHAIAQVERDSTNDMPKEKVTFSIEAVN
jgi:cyclophilin family peptidyl-prolyl cis-trans isomerase